MIIPFTLNHQQVYVDVDHERRLSCILREVFSIPTVHDCCRTGHCGSCIVLWENKIANACLISMGVVPFTDVLTLEGFYNTPILESILLVFRQHNVILCPYCYASRILSIINLLQETAKVTETDIIEIMEIVRCACTNYDVLKTSISNLTLIKESYD